MHYNDLKKIAAGSEEDFTTVNESVKKLLSPRPLNRPEDLVEMISARFRYTGPGKWVKILKEADKG
ncbi:MAG TPA: hypothetical protein DCO79_10220 [Spirochaeta sp.]|nr:hypothetical protein [Spirochaeta sp.]